MRILFMIAGVLVCSMVMLACGAFGPKKDDDMAGKPSVNIPRNMANADDDPAIERDFAHTISVLRGGDIFVAKVQYPLDILPDLLTARSKDNFSGAFYLNGDFDVEWRNVVGVLDAIRKSGSKNVNLIVAKGASDNGKTGYGRLQVDIPAEPTDAGGMKKPNPLALELKVSSDGKIRLNDSDKGDVDDTAVLVSLLKEIFQQRAAGSTSDRSMTIRAVTSGRYGNVVKLINAAKGAGAGPIIVAIDDLLYDDVKDVKDTKNSNANKKK